jgi:hypothetical protein
VVSTPAERRQTRNQERDEQEKTGTLFFVRRQKNLDDALSSASPKFPFASSFGVNRRLVRRGIIMQSRAEFFVGCAPFLSEGLAGEMA